MSGQFIETIANGETFDITAPGNYFHCYAASKELTFEVRTEDGVRELPLDRGTGWQAPFKKIVVKNNSGSSQTITVIALQIPGLPVRGFIDSRELAAQVAVDGGIITNTAPLTDQGGSVHPLSASASNILVDATAATVAGTAITAASNTNGFRLRYMGLTVVTAAAGKYAFIDIGTPQHMSVVVADGHDHCRDEIEVPAGYELKYTVQVGMIAVFTAQYDFN